MGQMVTMQLAEVHHLACAMCADSLNCLSAFVGMSSRKLVRARLQQLLVSLFRHFCQHDCDTTLSEVFGTWEPLEAFK